jgi:hypothetical protein
MKNKNGKEKANYIPYSIPRWDNSCVTHHTGDPKRKLLQGSAPLMDCDQMSHNQCPSPLKIEFSWKSHDKPSVFSQGETLFLGPIQGLETDFKPSFLGAGPFTTIGIAAPRTGQSDQWHPGLSNSTTCFLSLEEPAEVQFWDTPAPVACSLLPRTEKASPRAEKHLCHL